MGDQGALGVSSRTANDTMPIGSNQSELVKPEEQLHQEGKTSLAVAGHASQQADLLQVMQDVNGRFIANAAKQLRKRAISLCVEELKEYKRSKMLNILTAPKGVDATGSRPSSASYLIPALPHSGPAACGSEPVSRHDPSGRRISATEQGHQASAAQVKPDPDCEATVQLQAASAPPLANGTEAQPQMSDRQTFSKHPGSLQTDRGPAHAANCMQGSSAEAKAGEPMPYPAAIPSTAVSSHGPARNPAKPITYPVTSCKDKQQGLQLSKQQVPWSQHRSQRDQWEHASSQDFAQAKLACTPSFPFSKQPCAVMW